MIDAKRIEEMKRLSAEITEGPWYYFAHEGLCVAKVSDDAEVVSDDCGVVRYNDAQFIAESRQFVPDIIAAYEEQAEELAELRVDYSKSIKQLMRRNSQRNDLAIKSREQAEEIAKLRKALEEIAEHFDMCYRRKPSKEPQFIHCLEADKIAREALQNGTD